MTNSKTKQREYHMKPRTYKIIINWSNNVVTFILFGEKRYVLLNQRTFQI